MAEENAPTPPAAGSLFASRPFLAVWSAGILNGVMRWLELLVVGLYVFQQTGSPFLVALVSMLRLLPMALFGPFLGALADTLGRRRLYLAVTVLAALATGAQALLAALDAIEIWHLAIGCFISGAYWTADMPVRRILLGEIAGGGRVAKAIVLDTLTNNLTRMLGPLVGGGVLQLFGLTGAFLVGLASCLLAFLLVWRVRDPGPPPTGGGWRIGATVLDGLRIARANRAIVATLLITVLFNVFSFPTSGMVPVIGEAKLLLTPALIGLLSASEGAGASLGSLAIAIWGRQAWFRPIYWGGLLLCFVSILLFAAADWAVLAGIALFCMGVGVAGFSAMQTTLIYLAVPPQARSRVMGLVSFCVGTAPLGFLHIGWLADWLGPPIALAVMAAEGLLLLLLLLWHWPESR